MTSAMKISVGYRLSILASMMLLFLWLATSVAQAQVSERAEPVTGPGVTTIGGIAAGARINIRSGPSVLFPVIGTLAVGTVNVSRRAAARWKTRLPIAP